MIGTDIQHAISVLNAGNLVAIPTETVYGLAANALNEEAVIQIFKAKKRPFFDPLIVHIHSFKQLEEFATNIPEKAKLLADEFWPGPLTLILPKSEKIPDLVTSGLGFVGLRMPAHPISRKLLQQLDFPLAAPSANPFGYVSPTTAQHVENQLGAEIDYIIDGGSSLVGIESTIISFAEAEKPVLLRYGGITQEEIEHVIGPISIQISSGSKPDAPGQLDKHYATTKPIKLSSLDLIADTKKGDKSFVIGFGQHASHQFNFNLSPSSNLVEATQNLFKALRLADESEYESIVVYQVPEIGLGKAINDRLRRAAFMEVKLSD